MDLCQIKKIFILPCFVALVAAMILSQGCAHARKNAEVYNMSYDKTYSTAISALDDMESWYLLETDELNGLITVERSGYLYPDQRATVIVERLGAFRTKVEVIEKEDVLFTGKFLKAIDKRVENRALTYPS